MRPEQASTAGSEPAARILIVGIGGTIAMRKPTHPSSGGAVPELDASSLVDAVPELANLAKIRAATLDSAPSAQLGLETVLQILELLETEVDTYDGFVVTTGTDTLEEIAYGIDLLWEHDTPVVVTGAMRSASSVGADGPSNLLASVQCALSHVARGLGCLVVLNDEIHAARFVAKRHSNLTSAFQSPGLGPLGWIIEGSARMMLRPMHREVLPARPTQPLGRVAMVRLSLGGDGGLLGGLTADNWDAVVVEALGGGHVPPSVADEMERLVSAGVVVALASRTGAGAVLERTYGFRGSESDLIARGVWPTGVLPGPKTQVLLSLLLAGSPRLAPPEARGTYDTICWGSPASWRTSDPPPIGSRQRSCS